MFLKNIKINTRPRRYKMIFPCWLMFLVLMPGRAVFRSSMVLRTWTQTSKVGLRSKEKQEAETGTQTLLELKVQSIWRKPRDGMGSPGGWPLAAGPRDRSPWPVPVTGGTPGTSARPDATPAVTQHRTPGPARGRVPGGRLHSTAPRRSPRAAPPGPPRPTAALLCEPSSTRSNSQSGDRVSTAIAAAPPTDTSPSSHRRDAGLTPAAVTPRDFRPRPRPRAPEPVDSRPCGPRAPLGKRVRPPAPVAAAIVTVAVGILHPFSGLTAVCVCSQATFSFSLLCPGCF